MSILLGPKLPLKDQTESFYLEQKNLEQGQNCKIKLILNKIEDELVRLGELMVTSSEGTRVLAVEFFLEFEDKFLQHIMTGEGSGWKVDASFEGNFPNRIKQLLLDRHFDLKNIKRIVLEADGYQLYLISPQK